MKATNADGAAFTWWREVEDMDNGKYLDSKHEKNITCSRNA